MEDRVIETIDKYFAKQNIDKVAANAILDSYKVDNDIDDYAKTVEFNTKPSDVNAEYDHINSKIIIYPKRIEKKVLSKYPFDMRGTLKEIRIYNLELLASLFHEVTHAEQRKIRETEQGFISDILRDSNNLFLTKPFKYNSNYEVMVEEYNAYFKAYLYLQQYDPAWAAELVDNFTRLFYDSYYRKDKSPYEIFQKKAKTNREIPEMSVYNRAQYGLPLKDEDKTMVLHLSHTRPRDLEYY